MKLLLFVSLWVCLLFSCQSEYDRQMQSAIQHKHKLTIRRDSLDMSAVKAIEEQIYFCAELSGSKATFLKELALIP